MTLVYVRLLDEGTTVYRPVTATQEADGTYVLGTAPPEVLEGEMGVPTGKSGRG
jgi:hypothetical protein